LVARVPLSGPAAFQSREGRIHPNKKRREVCATRRKSRRPWETARFFALIAHRSTQKSVRFEAKKTLSPVFAATPSVCSHDLTSFFVCWPFALIAG
jgi:hypothetical protein